MKTKTEKTIKISALILFVLDIVFAVFVMIFSIFAFSKNAVFYNSVFVLFVVMLCLNIFCFVASIIIVAVKK